jgi:hypothetical protein
MRVVAYNRFGQATIESAEMQSELNYTDYPGTDQAYQTIQAVLGNKGGAFPVLPKTVFQALTAALNGIMSWGDQPDENSSSATLLTAFNNLAFALRETHRHRHALGSGFGLMNWAIALAMTGTGQTLAAVTPGGNGVPPGVFSYSM